MRPSTRTRGYRQEARNRRQHFHNHAWLAGAWIGAVAFLVAALCQAWSAATGTDPSLWWWAGGYAVVAFLHVLLAWLVLE